MGTPGIGAVVDLGSNSIHLLVAALDENGLRPIVDESVQLGVGDVVDRLGHLPAESYHLILRAFDAYARKAAALGAETLTQLATEPLRRASNRSVIQSDVLQATGRPLWILSHDAEAHLTLLGATDGRPLDASLLVVDVGGGSSELIVAGPGHEPAVAAIPTGSARLTGAFVSHDPPTWLEINALRAEARRLVEATSSTGADLQPARGVAVGGSATNLVRIRSGASVPGTLDRVSLALTFAVLASRTAAEVASVHGVSLRRAGQLAAGAALIDAVVARYRLPYLEISTASLREGALIAARHGSDWLRRLPELIARGGTSS